MDSEFEVKEWRTEHDEQAALISLVRTFQDLHPALRWFHSSLNGARLARKEAKKMKEEGLTKGIPDLCLPWPARGYHIFYIEMKRPGNPEGLTREQREFSSYCEKAGMLMQVFDDAEAAWDAICWYLDLKNPLI